MANTKAGTASQYEMVRGLGKLLKKGWRPLRSIVLASWDAEEYGLVGSTEWCEVFGSWLKTDAAAYLNLDSSTSGQNFGAAASPTLARVVRGAAQDVESSDAARSIWDTRADGGDWEAFWAAAGERATDGEFASAAEEDGSSTGVEPLGSGSDYTAFLMRYGVASTDFSFGGGPKDPVYHYHSIYDSHTWIAKYGDPGFHKHVAGAKIIGLIALRVADSLILPFNTTQYAHDMEGYLAKIQAIKDGNDEFKDLDLDKLRDAIKALQHQSAKYDTYRESLLKKLHNILRKRSFLEGWYRFKEIVYTVWNGVGSKEMATWESTEEEAAALATRRPHLPPHKRKQLRKILTQIRAVNRALRAFESGFISEEGIKDREWYKHKGTSPGKWLGYGATTVSILLHKLCADASFPPSQRRSRSKRTCSSRSARPTSSRA